MHMHIVNDKREYFTQHKLLILAFALASLVKPCSSLGSLRFYATDITDSCHLQFFLFFFFVSVLGSWWQFFSCVGINADHKQCQRIHCISHAGLADGSQQRSEHSKTWRNHAHVPSYLCSSNCSKYWGRASYQS